MDRIGIKTLLILCAGLSLAASWHVIADAVRVLVQPVPPPAIIVPAAAVEPLHIVQGDPIMITISGVATTSANKSHLGMLEGVTFNGVALPTVVYGSTQLAFVGIDLNKKPGTYPLIVKLSGNRAIKKNIRVVARANVEAPLGIPEKLGGNTDAAAAAVVAALSTENAVLAGLVSAKQPLWSGAFHFPVTDPVVTDVYGYSRQTGQYEIAHKGTDFKAPPGTKVFSINDGKVIFAGDLGIYGNTIAVDHGLGILSFYMHLSEIDVKKGQPVSRDQIIGLSGETGYAEGPHLHLSIRINGISIDPLLFLRFF